MPENPAEEPLLTLEEVRSWAVERAEALARVAELDLKLQGVRLLFPDLATKLFGAAPPPPRPGRRAGPMSQESRDALPLHAKPITDIALFLLEDENGGRPPRWFIRKMREIPGLAERVERSPNSVNNALTRLASRERLVKDGDRYYLPDVFDRIQRGQLQEEVADTPHGGGRGVSENSFNSLMHKAMRSYGKPFRAADAMEVAKLVPELRKKIEEQPARVYGWLTREISRKNLAKEGRFYFYPSERDEALNGKPASASVAGEVAASPIESQPTLRLIG